MTLYSHTNFWFFHHIVLITQHARAIVKGSIPVGPLIHQLGVSGYEVDYARSRFWHDCLLFSFNWEMTCLVDHLHHRSLSVLTCVRTNRYENILTQALCWNGLFWYSIKPWGQQLFKFLGTNEKNSSIATRLFFCTSTWPPWRHMETISGSQTFGASVAYLILRVIFSCFYC